MGIQDRDYYRNEGPSIFDSLMPSGLVCRWLIGINIAVFLLQLVAQTSARAADPNSHAAGWVTDWLILDVDQVRHGQVWRLLTYAFLHDTNESYFLHLLFNMLFLWWFGSDVEQLYGRKEFLAIYLISATVGGIAYEGWSLARGTDNACLGASGAVTSMLVLCALHFPRRIIYLFMMLPVPIWFFAVFSVARDAFTLFAGHQTNVAVIVHLAGAAFAVAYYKWQRSLSEIFRIGYWWPAGNRSRARLKIYHPENDAKHPVAVSAAPDPLLAMDEHLEAKLDAVLEKIAKTGKESLTQQEQEILQRAAMMYKKRRN